MKHFLIISLFFATIITQAQIINLSALEFSKRIKTNDGILLDVRTPGEYARGHIAGSKMINLQDPQIQKVLLALPKNKPLYLYCYSGARSMSVANFLSQNGFSNIINMQRGLIDWSSCGFILESGATTALPAQPDFYTVTQYQQLLTKKGLVFIDFYAPWCAPCKQMMPMINELEKTYKDKISFEKINTDASKEVALKAGVKAVPYLVLYKNEKVIYTKDGLVAKEELKKVFDSFLATP